MPPKPPVHVDSRQLDKTILSYALAAKISAKEAVNYAARQVAQHAQKETILVTGRGHKGRASTVAQAKREQQELWKSWILGMGFPRMTYWPHHRFTAWKQKSSKSTAMRQHWFSFRMSQKDRKRYFSVAKKLQGRLAAGWNAAIAATGGKYAAAWVKRHGNIHGTFTRKNFENRELALIKFGMDDRGDSRGVLRVIAELAIKKTLVGMKNAAERIIKNTARKTRRR